MRHLLNVLFSQQQYFRQSNALDMVELCEFYCSFYFFRMQTKKIPFVSDIYFSRYDKCDDYDIDKTFNRNGIMLEMVNEWLDSQADTKHPEN